MAARATMTPDNLIELFFYTNFAVLQVSLTEKLNEQLIISKLFCTTQIRVCVCSFDGLALIISDSCINKCYEFWF